MRVNGDSDEMQRMANTRLWRCVEEKGGITAFIKLTGLSRQTVYGIKDNRSMPSGLSIGMIHEAIPELDINALFAKGESTEWEKISAIPAVVTSSTTPRRIATEGELQVIEDLHGIIDAKDQEIGQLKGELQHSQANVVKLKDELLKQVLPGLDFLRSGSRPTAVDLMTRAKRVDGLIRYDQEEVECKVLPLNNANSLLNQAYGVLNSLAPFEVYKKVV